MLAATTKRLGGNMRFSAMLCNLLVAKRLSKNEWAFRSCFSFSRCETCLTERRYMVFRNAKRGLSQHERCLMARARRNTARWKRKISPFRSLVHSKIRHNFLTKRPDKAPHGHRQKDHGRLVCHVRSVYLLDRCLLRYFNPNRSLDRKKRCQESKRR